jgi:hypothetical protein
LELPSPREVHRRKATAPREQHAGARERAMKTDKEEMRPVCPHCEKMLERLVEVKGKWHESVRVVCCPFCKKILGVWGSH